MRSLTAVILVVAVLSAACGGAGGDGSSDPPAPEPSNPTTAPPTTASPDDAAAAEVEAAYLAYNEMFQRLLESPDPDDPELEQRLTGEALDALRENLRQLKEANEAVRFGPQDSFEVVSLDITGDEAVIRECAIDDADQVDLATGQVVEPGPIVTVLGEVSLRRIADSWRVTRIQQIDGWPGITECAE